MIICFLIRRVLGTIALLAFFGQVIMLVILAIKKEASNPTPAYLSIMMRASQIISALLVITIQIYHWKALLGVGAVLDLDPDSQQVQGKADILSNMEDGQEQTNGRPKYDVDSSDVRQLSYSEIVTGDRSNCGYSSQPQRTETYKIYNVDNTDDVDDNGDDETKTEAEERSAVQDSRRPSRIMSKKSFIRFSTYNKCESNADEFGDPVETEKPVAAAVDPSSNDLTSLLTDNNHAQLSASKNPILSDKSTWVVVMATCICFLITAIPASLRSYLSAFLLYSLATRVLEIAAASLLLSPFQFQSSAFRKRLAAKIKEVSSSHLNTSTTLACDRDLMVRTSGDEKFRKGKGGRYTGLVNSDNDPSSLTVSILHQPNKSNADPAVDISDTVKVLINDVDKGESLRDYITPEVDIVRQQNFNEVIGGRLHVSPGVKDNSPVSRGKSSLISRKLPSTRERPLEVTDGAWVDRWAKNIHNGNLPTATNDNAIQMFESAERVSCTSSVTSATNLVAMGQRNLVGGINYLRGGGTQGPCTLTPFNQPQQAIYECLDKSQPLPSNAHGTAASHAENSFQHIRQSFRSIISSNEKGSPLEDVKGARGVSEVSNDVTSTRSENEALKQSASQSQSLSDSPRSVAHTAQSEVFSPLTASVMTLKMSKRLHAGVNSSAEVAGMMTMTAIKPQEKLGLLRSNQMKMSVVTKDNSSTMKGEKSNTRTNTESDEKISNYYDKWVRQSTPASKLTYRGGSRSSGQECKSPRSPKSPEMKSYDGDVDRDYRNMTHQHNSNGSRQSRKKNHTSGLRSSERFPHSGSSPVLPSSSPVLADSSIGSSSAPRSTDALSHSRSSSAHGETKENDDLIASALAT